MISNTLKYSILVVAIVLLFFANVFFGSVSLGFSAVIDVLKGVADNSSVESIIVLNSRVPQAITALGAGAALAVSGLLLQTLFNNPLAAPSILGISSGSGLGVAFVMLFFSGSVASLGLYGYISVVLGAMVGAMLVLLLLILFSTRIKSNTMLLVIGIMVGYVASSLITLLNYYAERDSVVSYVLWGMGDFSSVNNENLLYFSILISIGLFVSILMIKPLNALLLGDKYAQNLGINIPRIRIYLLLSTGLLTAIVTAFCGPISFIGLAVPHIARLTFKSSNHRVLIPSTILVGGALSLLCNLLTVSPLSGNVIPLNAITPLMGAPVIIYVIINKSKIAYFN